MRTRTQLPQVEAVPGQLMAGQPQTRERARPGPAGPPSLLAAGLTLEPGAVIGCL